MKKIIRSLPTRNNRLGGGLLENRKEPDGKKKKIVISVLSIVTLLMVVSFSYAYIKYDTKENNANVLGTECIKIEMEEMTEALSLYHAFPVDDKTGKESNPFKFKLINRCGTGVDYQINLEVEKTEEKQIAAKNIATLVDENEKIVLTKRIEQEEGEEEKYKIGEGTLKPYEEKIHEVRIWLDENADNESQNGIFKSKVEIEAKQNQVTIYSEQLLQGADPVLDGSELVPVKIDENNGEVTKADLTTDWYKYEEKRWANAVILANGKTESAYKAGEKIEEKDIESYFVWIPKYSYKIFDKGEYTKVETDQELTDKGSKTAIEIRFGIENTTDGENECRTPKESGQSGTCDVDDWMTHPAFLAFGGNGIWVGKFETGYNQSTNNSLENTSSWNEQGAQHDTKESNKIIIKPNVYSWRNINVSNAFNTSKEYKETLQSHMLKNTEWGAVAYLTQSIYGRCDKQGEEATCTEVRINNTQNYVTGYAAMQAPTKGHPVEKDHGDVTVLGEDVLGNGNEFKGSYSYSNPESKIASTTGKYTGIYDMSGGAYEFVAGVVNIDDSIGTCNDSNGSKSGNCSGLTKENLTESGAQYYDSYDLMKDVDFNKRILGDATGEMGKFERVTYNGNNYLRVNNWYEDWAWLPDQNFPWFGRGGYFSDGKNTGVFAFNHVTGSGNNLYGFRVALVPMNG